jgi:FixJ family two-component response regulator/DNA-binding transcriptional ArsR family regulator
MNLTGRPQNDDAAAATDDAGRAASNADGQRAASKANAGALRDRTPGLDGRASAFLDRSAAGPAREGQRHFKVLSLVDEPPGFSEVPQLLRGDGFQVTSCRTTGEALRHVGEDVEIGIIVCDVQLEDARGPHFFRRVLEKVPSERPLSVIFLAEAASINDVVAAMRLQAIDFLRKPTHPPTLLEAARRADRLMYRRSTERLMLKRATDLLEVMQSVVDWLPGSPSVLDDEAAAVQQEEVRAVGFDADRALALERTKKELRRVKSGLKAQKVQRKIFGVDLVANPCWDMLLDLYEKMLLNRPVSVSSLALASGVPITTALRRMAKLEDLGLVRRGKDAADARRVFVELTEAGLDRLGRYFEEID